MGSPSGSSGTGTGSTANVYEPQAQPQADQNYQNILASLLGPAANAGAGTPAAQNYGYAQNAIYDQVTSNPYYAQALTGTEAVQPLAGSLLGDATSNAAGLSGLSNLSSGAGQQLYSTAFDPQKAIFNQGQGQLIDQSNAVNSMSGLGASPYGAGVTSNALGNYDLGYQKQQLANETAGASGLSALAGAASGAASGAQSVGATGINTYTGTAAAPANISNTQAATDLSDLSSLTNLGEAQYQLPQQTLNDLQSYLGLGQAASMDSGQLGAQGLQELGSSLQGVGGVANTLLGGSSGSSGSALSGLLGGSSGGNAIGSNFAGGDFSGTGSAVANLSNAGDFGTQSSGGSILSSLSSILPFGLGTS